MSMSLLGRIRRSRAARPKRDPEGRMTLIEHLRELRQRLFKSLIAIIIAAVVAWWFREPLFDFVFAPLFDAIERIKAERPDIQANPNFDATISPLTFMFKLSLAAGLVATCPIWMYQLWSFIMPGLKPKEKRWAWVFAVTASPLFMGGVVVGYLVMEEALRFIINLTPDQASNFINAGGHLDFTIRLLLVFGVAFEVPIFVIGLNLVGLLPAERIAKWRRMIIFSFFVFGAVATPTGDPITMMMLSGPMTLLFICGEVAARILEKRRRERLQAEGYYFDVSVDKDE